MEELFNALIKAIKDELGLESVLLPQTARTSTGHIDLTFHDIKQNGENGESLTLYADYRSGGINETWCIDTAKAKRKLLKVDNGFLTLSVAGTSLRAYWQRRQEPLLEYPDDNNSSMPVDYVAPYAVQIDYPASLIAKD